MGIQVVDLKNIISFQSPYQRLEGKVPIVEITRDTQLPFDKIVFNDCDIEDCHCQDNCITI